MARPVLKPIIINGAVLSPVSKNYVKPVFLISACATYFTATAESDPSDILTYPYVVYGFDSVTLEVEDPIPDYVLGCKYYITWGLSGVSDAAAAIQAYGVQHGAINVGYPKLRLVMEILK